MNSLNSLVKVFSNFREFYSEINGATLTGAIDVVVVEQEDGSFLCSPFHVRFGKLGVLRSREKVVDIEINGEPVNIHMKLGESGEAFFVEECSDDDEELPENLATSPIPTSEFSKYDDGNHFSNASDDIQIPRPRRNSIDLAKESDEAEKKFENQISDYSYRRHTDNTLERRDLSVTKQEYTTQKLRQEWAEHEETIFSLEGLDENEDWNQTIKDENKVFRPIVKEANTANLDKTLDDKDVKEDSIDNKTGKDESKSKKKRRKKSALKKKNMQRKNSSSSSAGSTHSEPQDQETDTITVSNNTGTSSSTEESPIVDESVELSKTDKDDQKVTIPTVTTAIKIKTSTSTQMDQATRLRDLDIHFFSDTEAAHSPRGSRPSTPVQSDTEFEVTQREKSGDNDIMTSSASWKWGELPTQADDNKEINSDESKQAQRNSMLSGMFSFMKQTKKMRKNATEGLYLSDLDAEGMDPEVAALYFPPITSNNTTLINISQTQQQQQQQQHQQQHNNVEEDRESGNGTSLPQSPSSMEGAKNSDSDYEEGKPGGEKYLDFVSMSLCGGLESGGPLDEDFDRNIVQYAEVCQNPSLFSSPNLVVRLNGKYYSWGAACPIVMTMITFQKPLPCNAVKSLMQVTKPISGDGTPVQEARRGYSWFSWRRQVAPGGNGVNVDKTKLSSLELKDAEVSVVAATQTSRSTSPDTKLDETSSNINIKPTNLSISSDNSDRSDLLLKSMNEKFKKTLRLSTEQIECLNLKTGMNEVVFSVTTAYQGTTRCKCFLFKWKHNDKVVISDIDGTITKSDVLGHLLPMVGKDWAQIGVAQLFSKIEENGYKLLYLSARAIGQSRATREYLRSIRQGDVKLPDGPLLLNPTSLISAFHREVIERKPEQFKIACLSDIQALFPENPFYAGYGNRINDVWAYRAVGIPIMRIFTINTKGELKHELTQTFQSTYAGQSLVVNDIFPRNLREYETDSCHSSSHLEDNGGETSDDEIELDDE